MGPKLGSVGHAQAGPSADVRFRECFGALGRLVEVVKSRSSSVFSEVLDELADELRPALGMAFSLEGDTLLLAAEHRLGSVVPTTWRQFDVNDPLAEPLVGALRSRQLVRLSLGGPAGADAFAAWGPQLARNADVAWVVPVASGARVRALLVLFFDERRLAQDESVLPFLQTASALLGLAVALRDERAHAASRAAQLDETTRLATLGTLSATVTHELRGPAGALALLVPELQQGLAQLGPGPAEALAPLVNDMRVCVERIGRLCGQLGNLNHRDEAPERFDARSLAEEVAALARTHAQEDVVVVEELGAAPVFGLRDQLGQVLLNLALNAIDACREGPRAGERRVIVRTCQADGTTRLEVADSGPGLPDGDVERIFRPFFTTKPRGKGTGLGLSVSRDIVRSHRGHIEVGRSHLGGALFRVVLPAPLPEAPSPTPPRQLPSPAPPRQIPSPAPPRTLPSPAPPRTLPSPAPLWGSPPPAARPLPPRPAVEPSLASRARVPAPPPPLTPAGAPPLRVLFVDDDPLFLRTMKRVLRGCDTTLASTLDEAHGALASGAVFDVVVTDVNMPGGGGLGLHRRLARERAPLAQKILFLTGGALTPSDADALRRSGRPCLPKLVAADVLLAALCSVASAGAAPPAGASLTLRPAAP